MSFYESSEQKNPILSVKILSIVIFFYTQTNANVNLDQE